MLPPLACECASLDPEITPRNLTFVTLIIFCTDSKQHRAPPIRRTAPHRGWSGTSGPRGTGRQLWGEAVGCQSGAWGHTVREMLDVVRGGALWQGEGTETQVSLTACLQDLSSPEKRGCTCIIRCHYLNSNTKRNIYLYNNTYDKW